MKLFFISLSVILIIFLVLIVVPKNLAPTEISIPAGISSWQICQNLAQADVIRQPLVLMTLLLITNKKDQIVANDYLFTEALNYWQVLQIITQPKSINQEQSITIIEGWTNEEIAQYLAQQNIVSVAEFKTALAKDYDYDFLATPTVDYLQGYLFPDTYRIYQQTSAEEIINKMLDNFSQKISAEIRTKITQKKLKLTDVINLASIIEKEVPTNQDRRLVADIFWRRLQDNYPLQSDATVNYITHKGTTQPSYTDTEIQSAYNTYRQAGLPPGP
ncbi:MAG: endolytic transglycosylase MltG, partial [Candidatus Komeilibacteria bacterium CG_4_9_14_3_um_filter_37_5]